MLGGVIHGHERLLLELKDKLGADVTLPEDRLALDIVTGHHQPVDARELLERDRLLGYVNDGF